MSKHNNHADKNHLKLGHFAAMVRGEHLDLSNQGFTDKDVPDIILFLQHYPEVKRLNLSLNNIGDEGIDYFSERNPAIIQADFAGNIISDVGLGLFAHKNQLITHVNFSQNPISDEGILNFAKKNRTCRVGQFSVLKYH